MRLSHFLVITAATLLFASQTVAVATSNQAKTSKMVQSSPSQRLLRSNHYLVKEEEDESEDSVDLRGFATPDEEDLEERGPLPAAAVARLDEIASRWGTTYEKVAMGYSNVSKQKFDALIAMRDALLSGKTKDKNLASALILMANKS
ncbi:hypothetical protein DVH05_014150 [Phytophthora capsici]|nr:hypothetical protein DVH05_014150 [Phytophthora capsici]